MSRRAGPSQRQLRVGELLRHALAEIFERASFHDPDLADARLTVTAVDMSPDLRHANVFVVPFAGTEGPRVLPALNRAAAYLRRQLAGTVDMRYLPDLHFKLDTSFGEASRITSILRRPEVARDLEADGAPDAAQDGGGAKE
ncbi:MAG: 30S ribosome-binding factor RbfA [Alphaproteobacteria bacterium]|nr:30S ribosome-binding factor RbfA [Alphaproteobacteria bacterium]